MKAISTHVKDMKSNWYFYPNIDSVRQILYVSDKNFKKMESAISVMLLMCVSKMYTAGI